METAALSIVETRDTGGSQVTYFGIKPGFEREAGAQLLGHLQSGAEVMLRNDLDEGNEGCTSFRYAVGKYSTMVGGHGWQSEWKGIDETGLLATVIELAGLNRGGRERNRGSISHSKASLAQ